MFDRVPPQDVDAERSVLGAMLLEPEAVAMGIEVLRDRAEEVFYAPAHQHIYAAMLNLYKKNQPLDAITLKEQLGRDGNLEGAGGLTYLTELSTAVPTAANVDHYAKIVLEAATLRRLIKTCTGVISNAYDKPEDANELLDQAEQEIFKIAARRQLNPVWRVGDLLEEGIHRIEMQIQAGSGVSGVPTGFPKLDELTSGFQRSDMIVLAARPSVGKTAFALNIAANAAINHGKSVLLFSLEMAKEQLVQRLLCMQGQINSRRLRSGFLAQKEFPKLTTAADRLSRAPIFIDDSPGINILDLRSKSRRQAESGAGCDMIIVDYLQLMSNPSARSRDGRQVEIADISRSIKEIGRELQVPIIALSQLNREADKDDMGEPKLSQLRESGAIEQDADVVMLMSRPPEHEREANPDLINVTLAKQRNGPTGRVQLMFDRNIQQFKNPADGGGHPYEPPPEYAENGNIAEEYEEEEDLL